MGEKIGAVVLAAGQGKRMGTEVAKQFLELEGKPLITYALEAFEASPVDEVILVTGRDQIAYCQDQIVKAFGFSKVAAVVCGGRERYHSVYEGLKAFRRGSAPDYVLIHDGARPLVTDQTIRRTICGAVRYGACVSAVPVKDTIKVSDKEGFAAETPDRRRLWQVQTPQAFDSQLLRAALQSAKDASVSLTDDCAAVERLGKAVALVEGEETNLKITTPLDLLVAEAILEERGELG